MRETRIAVSVLRQRAAAVSGARWGLIPAPLAAVCHSVDAELYQLLLAFLPNVSHLRPSSRRCHLHALGRPRVARRERGPESRHGSRPGAATPAANPADVASIDAILAALYDVIRGPGDRSATGIVCAHSRPGARLIPTGRRPDGARSVRSGQSINKSSVSATTRGRRVLRARARGRTSDTATSFNASARTTASAWNRMHSHRARNHSIQLWNDGQRGGLDDFLGR